MIIENCIPYIDTLTIAVNRTTHQIWMKDWAKKFTKVKKVKYQLIDDKEERDKDKDKDKDADEDEDEDEDEERREDIDLIQPVLAMFPKVRLS